MLNVLHIQRLPSGAQVSIERLFEGIRQDLPQGIQATVHVSPYPSRGLFRRAANLVAARWAARGRLSHITGDVHYLALALPGRTLVLTIHDCAVLHRLKGWRRWLLRKIWFEWPVRRAAVVTVISEATRKDLQQWLPSPLHSRIQVVPNCVRPEFTWEPKIFDEVSPAILQVGTGWNKNLEGVATALEGLPIRWIVIGPLSGERQTALKSKVPGAEFLGKVSDSGLVDAYRQCDLLIFASVSEGFGLPILEAQATGRPVITSQLEPMRAVSGRGALLVDPHDPGDIRRAVLDLIHNASLRGRLVERGQQNVASYQGPAVAAAYARIYRQVRETAITGIQGQNP